MRALITRDVTAQPIRVLTLRSAQSSTHTSTFSLSNFLLQMIFVCTGQKIFFDMSWQRISKLAAMQPRALRRPSRGKSQDKTSCDQLMSTSGNSSFFLHCVQYLSILCHLRVSVSIWLSALVFQRISLLCNVKLPKAKKWPNLIKPRHDSTKAHVNQGSGN